MAYLEEIFFPGVYTFKTFLFPRFELLPRRLVPFDHAYRPLLEVSLHRRQCGRADQDDVAGLFKKEEEDGDSLEMYRPHYRTSRRLPQRRSIPWHQLRVHLAERC